MVTHRLLLDTSSLAYRAFFAVPTSITDGRQRPVNGVRGYLDMTARLVVDRRPDELSHVLDHDWRPRERVAAWPGYKAQRAPDPEGLAEQFDLLREVLTAFGQRICEAPGWEADDAIAALCAQARDGDLTEIVTGDRDLLQLVRDARDGAAAVKVLYTVKGVSELREFDEAEIAARYGIPADRYVEYATLRGDASDGLPGVKGVGEKTARDLVNRYPTLDALLDAAAAQTPRLAQRLEEARGYLEAMRAVVPVRADVPVTTEQASRSDEQLDRLADERNLDGPIRRLREALDAVADDRRRVGP